MIKRLLVVGGANGIGLAISQEMAKRETSEIIYIVDKVPLQKEYSHKKIVSFQFDITNSDYSFFNRFNDIDALMITAGIGKLSLFKDVSQQHIIDSFNVNTISVLRIVKQFYWKIEGKSDFYCGIMDSIAGWMSSPFFAVYGATKSALKIFIESVNVELSKSGTSNKILNVSPGNIKGTSFYKKKTDLSALTYLACKIIQHLEAKEDLFIPDYDNIYKNVLERYYSDFRKEGIHSYEYKLDRINETKLNDRTRRI